MKEQTEQKVNNQLFDLEQILKELNNEARLGFEDRTEGDLIYLSSNLEECVKRLSE